MANYHLHNVLGHPMDTSLTIANLIFGGYLERWPGLKCCFCHAGGFAPYQIGRLDHAYKVRPEANRAIPQPPSVYLRRLYFDTIAHNVESLRLLIAQVGSSQVLLGSDYPADMSDPDPVNTVTSLGLEPADRARILGGNAAALLGIL